MSSEKRDPPPPYPNINLSTGTETANETANETASRNRANNTGDENAISQLGRGNTGQNTGNRNEIAQSSGYDGITFIASTVAMAVVACLVWLLRLYG
ncbi:hypothetical protein F4779DRAFT_316880 [Xylariaceae sp. FL0662B]|nr:hypothetical protein F4779DRAFT_316880 [Xylariaceae sp. FL0662B]